MKKCLKANVAIEAAVILPIIILMFIGMIEVLFYCHDKNIVTGAAYEVVAVGSREVEPVKEELGSQFQKRLNRKLIMFSKIHVDIWIEDSEIIMRCTSEKSGMKLQVQVRMSRTRPEDYIRNMKKIQKIGDEKKNENVL